MIYYNFVQAEQYNRGSLNRSSTLSLFSHGRFLLDDREPFENQFSSLLQNSHLPSLSALSYRKASSFLSLWFLSMRFLLCDVRLISLGTKVPNQGDDPCNLTRLLLQSCAISGGSRGSLGPHPPPPLSNRNFFQNKRFELKCFETEILTTEGLHMTIDWLIFKNETCVTLRYSTKYQTCSILYFFFDYPLMGGSARKVVVPGPARRLQKHLPSAI